MNSHPFNVIITTITLLSLITSFVPGAESFNIITKPLDQIFPKIEVTLSNDGTDKILYMCQWTDTEDSLNELLPGATYRFKFTQIGFPMRWCYLYINPTSHGFFWVYTVRARCTNCFWSINKHPFLYRGDRSRWERQKLYMPKGFNVNDFLNGKPTANTTTSAS